MNGLSLVVAPQTYIKLNQIKCVSSTKSHIMSACIPGPCRWVMGAGYTPISEHLPYLWSWQTGVFVEHRATQAGLVHLLGGRTVVQIFLFFTVYSHGIFQPSMALILKQNNPNIEVGADMHTVCYFDRSMGCVRISAPMDQWFQLASAREGKKPKHYFI